MMATRTTALGASCGKNPAHAKVASQFPVHQGRKGTRTTMSEERSWRETRFEDRGGRTGGSSWLGVAAGVLVIANFIVLLAAIQHDENRCGQDCYDVGLRTNEPGHSWTSYNGSWQWEAMYLL